MLIRRLRCARDIGYTVKIPIDGLGQCNIVTDPEGFRRLFILDQRLARYEPGLRPLDLPLAANWGRVAAWSRVHHRRILTGHLRGGGRHRKA